jgi:4-amino-4-deoxy-L-arabinose transferase-like glycosyltransferase
VAGQAILEQEEGRACPWPDTRRSVRNLAVEIGAVGLVLGVAALIRAPSLWDVPRFTDEANEAFRALLIVQGRLLPLTNVDPYIGALWNYLLAAAFLVAGPSLYLPRIVVAALGAATIVPTYLLGRSFGGPVTGALAAAFMALSPAHIAVNSHLAWSNCITPLLTTVALWLTARAVSSNAPSSLAWAGIAWGLALQTHPIAALFLPAAALYVALMQPAWLRSRWAWLAVVLAVLACWPLVVANVGSNFAGLEAGLRVQQDYSGGEPLSLPVYVRRLTSTLLLLTDGLGGALSESGPLRGPLGSPTSAALWYVLLVAMIMMVWRRSWMLLLAVGTYALLLPVVNARFESSVPKVRYVAPLLPLCYVAISMLVRDLHRRAGTLGAGQPSFVITARSVLTLGVALLLLAPLRGLQAYERQAIEQGRTNGDLYRTIAAVNAALRPGDAVYVDRALEAANTLGGGHLYDHLRFAAEVYGWQRVGIDVPGGRAAPTFRGVLVIAPANVSTAAAALWIEDMDSGQPEEGPARVFRVLGVRLPNPATSEIPK